MSNKPPAAIAVRIKDIVYREADNADYLGRDRVKNGIFLDKLVKHPQVGMVLQEHIPQAEVRTYIKDAILNRYSKDKTARAVPADLTPIIQNIYGADFVQSDKQVSSGVSLFRDASGKRFVVTAQGTYLKWETALRKALLYIPDKPFAQTAEKIDIALILSAQSRRITDAEKKHLNEALRQSNASAYICGER